MSQTNSTLGTGKLNIGIVIGSEFPYVSGGIEGVVYSYINSLSNKLNFFIFTSRPEGVRRKIYHLPPSTRIIDIPIPFSRFFKKIRGGGKILGFLWTLVSVPCLIKECTDKGLNILISMNPFFNGCSSAITTILLRGFYKRRVAFIVSIHGDYILEYRAKGFLGSILATISRAISHRVMSYCDIITVNGEITKKRLINRGINENKIKICRNGTDLKKFSKRISGRRIRNELKLNGKKVVTYIATIRTLKGHKYLLEAVPGVLKEVPEARFIFAGRGDTSKLLNLAKTLSIEDHIIFTGERPDIDEILAASDLFVLPSLTEGFPLTVLEAMASAVPVIATDVGEVPHVVKHGEVGYLVSPADSKSLAKYIVTLLEDDELRIQMGINARRIAEKYDWSTVSKDFLNVIEEAIENS